MRRQVVPKNSACDAVTTLRWPPHLRRYSKTLAMGVHLTSDF